MSVVLVVGVVFAYYRPWPRNGEEHRLLLDQTPTGRWQLVPRRSQRGPGVHRVYAVFLAGSEPSGLLRPMWREDWAGLRLTPINFSPSLDEYQAMRTAILDICESQRSISPDIAHNLKSNQLVSKERVLWNEVMLAIGIVAGAIAAILVMPWWWLLVEIPSDLWRVMTRHEDASRCRKCRYPLGGLPTRRCPECGFENALDPWVDAVAGSKEE